MEDEEQTALCLERLVVSLGADHQNGASPITSIGPVDPGEKK
jgi:hypothetical protein